MAWTEFLFHAFPMCWDATPTTLPLPFTLNVFWLPVTAATLLTVGTVSVEPPLLFPEQETIPAAKRTNPKPRTKNKLFFIITALLLKIFEAGIPPA
jgi:hypothetical protein